MAAGHHDRPAHCLVHAMLLPAPSIRPVPPATTELLEESVDQGSAGASPDAPPSRRWRRTRGGRGEERDLDGALGDRRGLADDLMEPRFGDGALALLVDVEPVAPPRADGRRDAP